MRYSIDYAGEFIYQDPDGDHWCFKVAKEKYLNTLARCIADTGHTEFDLEYKAIPTISDSLSDVIRESCWPIWLEN